MERRIIETRDFSKAIKVLLKKRQLLYSDYEDFRKELASNPEYGDLVTGTGGVRKIRLKSSSTGKSGGFRICYYYLVRNERIYLIDLYAKNKKENLTMAEKKMLKEYVHFLKGANQQ